MEAGARKGKRRCRRPESLRMRWKAPTWTLVVKATMDEGKAKITEVKRRARRGRSRNCKKIRGRICRDAGLSKRSKEHGPGRRGRTELCTKCNQSSAEADVSLRQSVQRKDPQLLAVGDTGR